MAVGAVVGGEFVASEEPDAGVVEPGVVGAIVGPTVVFGVSLTGVVVGGRTVAIVGGALVLVCRAAWSSHAASTASPAIKSGTPVVAVRRHLEGLDGRWLEPDVWWECEAA